MTATTASGERDLWIWSPRIDLGVFLAPTLFALFFLLGAHFAGLGGRVPGWAWLVFVLSVDVAHVWATLFRTYLDPEEIARRRTLYYTLPLACWAVGVALYAHSSLLFWKALA